VREFKTMDNDSRQLMNMKIALEEEVARLKKDLDEKDSMNQERDFEQGDLLERLQVANETIIDQSKKFKDHSDKYGKMLSDKAKEHNELKTDFDKLNESSKKMAKDFDVN
jgi:hypothetical protein